MRDLLKPVPLAVAAVVFCLVLPAIPPHGLLITDRTEPLFVGNDGFPWNGVQTCSWSLFGLISAGDASVRSAMRKAKLGRVALVERSVKGALGVYRSCTVVYGPFGDLGEPPGSEASTPP